VYIPVLAFHHSGKIPKETYLKEKSYFGFSFKGFSPGHLTPLFLGCGEAEHHGRKYVVEQNCLSHDIQEAGRVRKRPGITYNPFKGMHLRTHSLQLGPTS
jgi:hypothetical protein